MPKQLLTERFAFSGGKVRRGGKYPVIEGVLLCGPVSANQRRYKPEAFAGDRVKRYNGRPVYLDHGDGRASRGYRDKIGWIENARLRPDGMPEGDIAIKPTHPEAESVLWDAENKPDFAGMSHVAHCQTQRAPDGWEDVTEMVEAESVDIVVDPATTRGLYENRNRRSRSNMALTVRQLCEALVKHPKIKFRQVSPLKRLGEMDGMDGAMTAMDAPPADDVEPMDGVKDAFCTAISHVVDMALDGEMEAKEALRKIKELIASHEKVKGGSPGAAEEEEEEEEEYEEEGRRPKKPAAADPYAILAECKAAGYDPSPRELKYLATLPADERKEHIAEAKAKTTGSGFSHPIGASRRPGAGSAGKPPATPAATGTPVQKALAEGKIPKFDEL